MAAKLIAKDRFPLDEHSFVEIVIWQLPRPVRGSQHFYKYKFAYIEMNQCVVRYDNEAGKGDHKHIGESELPIQFVSISQLYDDFYEDVDQWRKTP
jgi:Family of unknown function (DUF6516)